MPLVNRKQVTISLPHELVQWLNDQAKREKRYPGRLIEALLEQYREYLENNEKNIFKKF